jgi:hypothetical protein
MFSTTTMASSTMIPETSTKAKSDTSLTELPVRYMKTMVTRKAKGMPTVVSPALRSPMKRQMMMETSSTPITRLAPSTRTESPILLLESWVTVRVIPLSAKDGANSATTVRTASAMNRALPRSILSICRVTQGWPFTEAMMNGSR